MHTTPKELGRVGCQITKKIHPSFPIAEQALRFEALILKIAIACLLVAAYACVTAAPPLVLHLSPRKIQ